MASKTELSVKRLTEMWKTYNMARHIDDTAHKDAALRLINNELTYLHGRTRGCLARVINAISTNTGAYEHGDELLQYILAYCKENDYLKK